MAIFRENRAEMIDTAFSPSRLLSFEIGFKVMHRSVSMCVCVCVCVRACVCVTE